MHSHAIDALICLGCGYVHFIQDDKESVYTLSDRGKRRITSLYSRMFPGHRVDVEDKDAAETKEARSKEWDRRYEATIQSLEPSAQGTMHNPNAGSEVLRRAGSDAPNPALRSTSEPASPAK